MFLTIYFFLSDKNVSNKLYLKMSVAIYSQKSTNVLIHITALNTFLTLLCLHRRQSALNYYFVNPISSLALILNIYGRLGISYLRPKRIKNYPLISSHNLDLVSKKYVLSAYRLRVLEYTYPFDLECIK